MYSETSSPLDSDEAVSGKNQREVKRHRQIIYGQSLFERFSGSGKFKSSTGRRSEEHTSELQSH